MTTMTTTTELTTESSSSQSSYLDYVETPLNPCSVESIPTPIALDDGRRIWPVMVGCYELQQDDQTRKGHLDLYGVQVPNTFSDDDDDDDGRRRSDEDQHNAQPKFGPPHNIMGSTTSAAATETLSSSSSSGILDGKWYRNTSNDKKLWYATAHSSGEMKVHAVDVDGDDKKEEEDALTTTNAKSPFRVHFAGQSSTLQNDDDNDKTPGLCLSLCWGTPTTEEQGITTSRIISSYSDGNVAVHQVAFQNNNDSPTVQFTNEHSWLAHKMFTSPAEVWTACFVYTSSHDDSTNLVMTGGDEGAFKLWDLRCVGSSSKPMHVIKDFEMGATVLSPHPRRDYLVACGSYDETVAVYDIRYFAPPATAARRRTTSQLCHSNSIGGGIWRIKWHPYDDDRLLVGVMHGGCRVVHSRGLLGQLDIDDTITNEDKNIHNNTDCAESGIQVEKKFTAHKSMAYGADWLVCQNSTRNIAFEMAASCSFYDRALYLWGTRHK